VPGPKGPLPQRPPKRPSIDAPQMILMVSGLFKSAGQARLSL
jgi:hypothetical protein